MAKNLNSEEQLSQKIIIPNYITHISTKYNSYVLPLYLFIKTKMNRENETIFSYEGLYQYYQYDKFNKSNESKILEALLFLLLGATVQEFNKLDELEESIIQESFIVSNRHNIIKNILSLFSIHINDETNTFTIQTESEYNKEKLQQLLVEKLKKELNLLLYDNTTKELKQYILVPNDIIKLIDWYCIQQANNYKKFQQESINDKEKLKELINKYRIELIDKNYRISYIILINIYIYIYTLYNFNQTTKQRTQISANTFAEKFSVSKSTVSSCLYTLQYLGLVLIKTGSYSKHISNSFSIINKWEDIIKKNLEKLNVFEKTIVTIEEFNQIKLCYSKNGSTNSSNGSNNSNDSNNEQTTNKRKRGRPRKNII